MDQNTTRHHTETQLYHFVWNFASLIHMHAVVAAAARTEDVRCELNRRLCCSRDAHVTLSAVNSGLLSGFHAPIINQRASSRRGPVWSRSLVLNEQMRWFLIPPPPPSFPPENASCLVFVHIYSSLSETE